MKDQTVLTDADCKVIHSLLTDLSEAIVRGSAGEVAALAMGFGNPRQTAYALALAASTVGTTMDPGLGVMGMDVDSSDPEDLDTANLLGCWISQHDEEALVRAVASIVDKGREHSLRVLINLLVVGTAFINGTLNVGMAVAVPAPSGPALN